MSSLLNVMLLTNAHYWPGSGISYAKIVRGLAERGHRIALVVGSDALAAEYARVGIPAQQLPLRRTGAREVFALHDTATENNTDDIIVDKPRDECLAAWVSVMRPMSIVIRSNMVGKLRQARFVDRCTAQRAKGALIRASTFE